MYFHQSHWQVGKDSLIFLTYSQQEKKKKNSEFQKDTIHSSKLVEHQTLGAEGTISSATDQASVVERLWHGITLAKPSIASVVGCMKTFLVLSISMWHPEWMPVLKPNSEEKYQKRTNIPQWRNIFKEDVVIKIPQKYFPINSRPKSKALKWDSKHKVLNPLLCA